MVSYGTIAQLQGRINLEEDLSEDKLQVLEEILEAVSRKIDNVCNVEYGFFLVEGIVAPDIREVCLGESTILFKRFEGAMASSIGSSDLGMLRLRIRSSTMSRNIKEFLVEGRHIRPLYGR